MSTTLDNTTTIAADHPATTLGQDAQQETPAVAVVVAEVAQEEAGAPADPAEAMVDGAAPQQDDGGQVAAADSGMDASNSEPQDESQENERKRKREGSDPSQAAESDVQSADEGDEPKSQAAEEQPEAKRRATDDDDDDVATDPEAPEQPAEIEQPVSQQPSTPLMASMKVLQAEADDSRAEALKVEE